MAAMGNGKEKGESRLRGHKQEADRRTEQQPSIGFSFKRKPRWGLARLPGWRLPPGLVVSLLQAAYPGYLDYSNWTVNVNRFLEIFSIFVVTYCSARTSLGECNPKTLAIFGNKLNGGSCSPDSHR